MLGRGTSYIGNAEYNRRNVSQKRSVLCAFFEAAAREEDLAELMESCDLANMLNLKESGPYLFDKDGRVQSVDASAKREYADDLTGAADYMRDNASKTAQELQKQFDDYQNSLQTKQQEILNSMLSADAAQMERLSSSLSLVEKKLEVTDDSMPHAIAMLNSFQSLVAGTIDEAAFNTQVDTQYTNFITTVVDPNATALTAATGEVARLEADLTNAKRAVTRCEGDLDAAKRPGRGVAVDPTRVAAAQTALDAAYDTIATVTTNLSTKKGEVSVLKNTQTSLKARAAWMQKVKALALKLETNRATNRAANPALYAKNLKQAVDSLSLTFRKETPPPASTTS